MDKVEYLEKYVKILEAALHCACKGMVIDTVAFGDSRKYYLNSLKELMKNGEETVKTQKDPWDEVFISRKVYVKNLKESIEKKQ